MRTTINALVGRRGDGAYSDDDLRDVMRSTRKILADTSALLELEIDKLFDTEVDVTDEKRIKDIKALIPQVQKCWQQVLDIEAKMGLSDVGDRTVLDLESARAEILGRLTRLIE